MRFERVEAMTMDGAFCAWEAESLWYGATALWAADPPDEENWCEAPVETSRTVDVLGQDGPFLSTLLREWSCCPEHATARCVTWDLRTGLPATLEQYDARHAARRWEKARQRAPAGVTLDRDAFVVGDGHVRFCAWVVGERVEVPVR